jgi:hypothetical protein
VRDSEGLVQVHVHDVESHVAGTHDAEDRVEIGAVVIEEPAHLVHGPGDLDDVFFEQAERVGVREHDAGDIGPEPLAQGRHIDAATGVGWDRHRLVAPECHRCRVGPVGGVRDDDLRAPCALAPIGMEGTHQQQAG